MISCDKGIGLLNGTPWELMADAQVMMVSLHESFVEKAGTEFANRLMNELIKNIKDELNLSGGAIMTKSAKLGIVKTIIVSVLILASAVTIIGDGDTWTPALAIAMILLLWGESKLNGEYRAEKRAKKRAEKARQKNARRTAIHTSKVAPFIKLTKPIIHEGERSCQCDV